MPTVKNAWTLPNFTVAVMENGDSEFIKNGQIFRVSAGDVALTLSCLQKIFVTYPNIYLSPLKTKKGAPNGINR